MRLERFEFGISCGIARVGDDIRCDDVRVFIAVEALQDS
jgi:hypothetical protein